MALGRTDNRGGASSSWHNLHPLVDLGSTKIWGDRPSCSDVSELCQHFVVYRPGPPERMRTWGLDLLTLFQPGLGVGRGLCPPHNFILTKHFDIPTTLLLCTYLWFMAKPYFVKNIVKFLLCWTNKVKNYIEYFEWTRSIVLLILSKPTYDAWLVVRFLHISRYLHKLLCKLYCCYIKNKT